MIMLDFYREMPTTNALADNDNPAYTRGMSYTEGG
jgi:hypothetical protein